MLAQLQPAGLSCTSSSVEPRILPSEGVAELASDMVIKCQGGAPSTPAGQPIPQVTFRAYLNTNVTSRLARTSPDLSEALLLIDEPSPAFQLPCPKLPCSITADSTSPYNGGPGHYNVFQATQPGGNYVEWAGVPIDPPGPGRILTLRITNVRASLNNLNIGFGASLVMFVMAEGPISIPINTPQQTVGFLSPGLKFTTTNAVLSSSDSHNTAKLGTDFTMTFAEGFSTVFKPRTTAIDPDDTSTNANQNVPGKPFGTTSGFYNASFSGTYGGAGLATQGTRLMAHFQNVPTGVSLYVTSKPTKASNTLLVRLVSTGPKGDGPNKPVVPFSANGFAQITVHNGSAIAVWEVLAASNTDLESAEFGVALSFPSPPPIGSATVRGSLAPITRVLIASVTDPVPRFLENLARPAFTITDGGAPLITAVVNVASYAADAPVSPGSVVAIFGTNLGAEAVVSNRSPVMALGGATVTINGIPAPIYATTMGQINAQVPWEVAGMPEASVRVTVDRLQSAALVIKLADTVPYIFILPDGRPVISRELPVRFGSLLFIFGTGFGPVNNQPATGRVGTLRSTTLNTPTVTIGGLSAEVTYSGLDPAFVGVWNVIVKIPEGLVFGPAVPVKVAINGIDANTVAISLP